jgi:hypothetical protein
MYSGAGGWDRIAFHDGIGIFVSKCFIRLPCCRYRLSLHSPSSRFPYLVALGYSRHLIMFPYPNAGRHCRHRIENISFLFLPMLPGAISAPATGFPPSPPQISMRVTKYLWEINEDLSWWRKVESKALGPTSLALSGMTSARGKSHRGIIIDPFFPSDVLIRRCSGWLVLTWFIGLLCHVLVGLTGVCIRGNEWNYFLVSRVACCTRLP